MKEGEIAYSTCTGAESFERSMKIFASIPKSPDGLSGALKFWILISSPSVALLRHFLSFAGSL